MRITILSENYTPFSLKLRGEHGFSVLIEKDNMQVLYDTGRFGVCVDNAQALGRDLTRTEKVLISHGHIDHTGGLEKVLTAIGHPVDIVTHPRIFEKKYIVGEQYVVPFGRQDVFIGIPFERQYLEKMLKASFDLQDGFYEAVKGVWLTGEVPLSNDIEKIPASFLVERNGILENDDFADDNSLVIDTDKGLVVVFGCAHRGIVNILTYVKKMFKKNIRAIIGGTHLHDTSQGQLEYVKCYLKELIQKEGVELFAPAHCTGINTIMDLCAEFKDITKPAFCGAIFEF
jgi:7,8-dihydropterin-6-yl-methyl-4-(beta-D-ribofuranosyl)aminobenzene 5'-phosphate synthase